TMLFDECAIGQPLVVNAARFDRLCDGHAMVDDIQDRLESSIDDGLAARRPGGEYRYTIQRNDRRGHAGKHALLGTDAISFRTDEAGLVGHARYRVEVTHFVVKQKTGALDHDVRSIAPL